VPELFAVWLSSGRGPAEAGRRCRHFLEVLDELRHLNIAFISFRENVDSGGAMIVIIGAISAVERQLIRKEFVRE
jgi:DNA invertase Pin-like site-specific DNA recombinase